MQMRTSLGAWSAAFFAALGWIPACSGDVYSSDDRETRDGGPGDGGPEGTGGAGETGGAPATGGTAVGGSSGAGGALGGGPAAGGAVTGGRPNTGGAAPGGSPGTGGSVLTGGTLNTGGVATGGAVSTGGTPALPFPCPTPQRVPSFEGEPTGFVQCRAGYEHRPEAVECPSRLPRTAECESGLSPDDYSTCKVDADCTERPHGYCRVASGGEQLPGCFCSYGCQTDADCGEGSICRCGEPVGQCVPATCKTDADCGGLLCSLYTRDPGCGGAAYACQTPHDECASDSDCGANDIEGLVCTVGADGRHVCEGASCAIGRPFLVAGQERLAVEAPRSDWHVRATPRIDTLSAQLRRELREAWTRIGLMEHASIAAFARFALQLLSLGAPADLIRRTHAAIADETRHAELAFGLASAYGGAAVGPGPLSVQGALEGGDLATVVETAVREGCIGETVAAIEAREAAAHATDPVVRTILERIARDEARHAELAWRFVQWVAEREYDGPALARGAFERALEAEGARTRALEDTGEGRLLAHGIVGDGARAELRRRVLAEVIEPGARALLWRSTRVAA